MLRFACIALLAVSTIAAPLPQAGDADVAPQDPASAASAGEPTIAFDPSSFSSGPDFGSGAPDGGSNDGTASTPALGGDLTSSAGNSTSLPDVSADTFGGINDLLSGLTGLQSNAGTKGSDDAGTAAELASLTGSAPSSDPTQAVETDAVAELTAGPNLEGATSAIGLLAAAVTDSSTAASPSAVASESAISTDSTTAEPASATLTPSAAGAGNATTSTTTDAVTATAAADPSSLTFDLNGFLAGASFDPAATAPAAAVAAAASTA
ncbi:hypothetical protein BMF94_0762 [Rhodotorula taiwanensis]|uniref:Uncharacterized protein n=1 Tax=Rhodotorula taiwanensis TaxID=741276 RepID=A0A2S5BGY7_9BASI|nr:hypothetical protein BMF94_0762 [Rhodotorula taiwanensis]